MFKNNNPAASRIHSVQVDLFSQTFGSSSPFDPLLATGFWNSNSWSSIDVGNVPGDLKLVPLQILAPRNRHDPCFGRQLARTGSTGRTVDTWEVNWEDKSRHMQHPLIYQTNDIICSCLALLSHCSAFVQHKTRSHLWSSLYIYIYIYIYISCLASTQPEVFGPGGIMSTAPAEPSKAALFLPPGGCTQHG